MGWRSGNVQMHVWPLEHCLDPIDRWHHGPHVTAVCPAEQWTARLVFSMHYDHVYLHDITPLGIRPKKALLQRLLSEVYQQRHACRALWWKNMHCVCLDNTIVVKPANGKIELYDMTHPQQGTPGRIVGGSGIYLAGQGVRMEVRWFSLRNTTRTTQEFLPEV